MAEAENDTSKFRIFRAADAPGLMEAGCMTVEPFTPVQRAGMDGALEAGYIGGDEIKVAPLTDEDRRTLVRWIDLGCPIDTDYDPKSPEKRGFGWMGGGATNWKRNVVSPTTTFPRASSVSFI